MEEENIDEYFPKCKFSYVDSDLLVKNLEKIQDVDDVNKLVPDGPLTYSNVTIGRKKHQITKEEIIKCVKDSTVVLIVYEKAGIIASKIESKKYNECDKDILELKEVGMLYILHLMLSRQV